MRRATNAQIIKFIWALLFLFPTSIQRKHNEEYLHGCTSLSCRRDNLLSEKADRFIVESKQLDLIRTKIGKHDAIDPQTFLRWNEASDKEKIKQKLGKAEKAKNQPKMRLLWYFYDTFLQQNTKSIIYYIYLLINALQIFLSQEWYFETFLSKKTIKQPTTLPIFFTSSIRT